MRYYDIQITSPDGSKVLQQWRTHPNGINAPPDPGAPLVEFDINQAYAHQPGGASFFRVWGISLQTAVAAQSYGSSPQAVGGRITVKAGMGKGLPLAMPQQAGTLVSGTLFQCFANWVGTNMTIEGYIVPLLSDSQVAEEMPNSAIPPANIVVNWPAQTQLGPAVQQAVQQAYPGYTVNINVSDKLVVPNQQSGTYGTIESFSSFVHDLSQPIIGGSYSGVNIVVATDGKTINVSDSSVTPSNKKTIAFTDLVGQVTWVQYNVAHIPVIMRGDLQVLNYIDLPKGQVTTTQSSFANFRQSPALQGNFQIIKLRHVGASRDSSGQSWVTNIFAVNLPSTQ